MFNSPYPFVALGKCDTNEKNPYRRIFYKFYAKHRTYLVTLELYSFQLVAIKYCDVKDKNAKNAYHKIFNDHDAAKVIGTCFHVMLEYWRNHPEVNFIFYASLRDIKEHLAKSLKPKEQNQQEFIENYKRVRYRIYRYGMVNLFPYKYFTPIADTQNCVYVLINKKQDNASDIISELKHFLYENHDVLFNHV